MNFILNIKFTPFSVKLKMTDCIIQKINNYCAEVVAKLIILQVKLKDIHRLVIKLSDIG